MISEAEQTNYRLLCEHSLRTHRIRHLLIKTSGEVRYSKDEGADAHDERAKAQPAWRRAMYAEVTHGNEADDSGNIVATGHEAGFGAVKVKTLLYACDADVHHSVDNHILRNNDVLKTQAKHIPWSDNHDVIA